MDLAIQVTLAIFAAGVIYHSGRLSVRVEHLEEWRREVGDELRHMSEGIASIVQAVNARKS